MVAALAFNPSIPETEVDGSLEVEVSLVYRDLLLEGVGVVRRSLEILSFILSCLLPATCHRAPALPGLRGC